MRSLVTGLASLRIFTSTRSLPLFTLVPNKLHSLLSRPSWITRYRKHLHLNLPIDTLDLCPAPLQLCHHRCPCFRALTPHGLRPLLRRSHRHHCPLENHLTFMAQQENWRTSEKNHKSVKKMNGCLGMMVQNFLVRHMDL